MSTRQLTARGVKMMLTRSGVDTTGLTITEQQQTVRTVDLHYTGPWRRQNSVTVAGSKDARRPARDALADRGLWCAGYPDHDEWSRR